MLNDFSRLKMMLDKLFNEMAAGRINDDWAERFIVSVRNQFGTKGTLSPAQINQVERLFERY